MVLEVTGIGQLEFKFGSIFSSPVGLCEPAVGAVGMWKSGTLFAGFPSPGERVGNSLWLFEFSTLSTGRHFHGALLSHRPRSAATQRVRSSPP
jgi:hypothetical protein